MGDLMPRKLRTAFSLDEAFADEGTLAAASSTSSDQHSLAERGQAWHCASSVSLVARTWRVAPV